MPTRSSLPLLIDTGLTVIPPRINLWFEGVDRGLFLVCVPADRQSLFFPSTDSTFVTLQVSGNFLPRIQAFAGGLRQVIRRLGFSRAHGLVFTKKMRIGGV